MHGGNTPILTVRNLTVRYEKLTAVGDLSFSIYPGDWLMLAGPNGAGKSSVLNAVSRGVPYLGGIFWENTDISTLSSRVLARHIGILSQNHSAEYAFPVKTVVSLGRYARAGRFFGRSDENCEAAVAEALRLTGLEGMENRPVNRLSGGELQRVFLAQLFAQDPELLILDEPANHLDPAYQKQIFTLISQWLERPGKAVISVVHDLSLAMRYGSRAILMDKGMQKAAGSIGEVFKTDIINDVYSMDVVSWMRELLGQWQKTSPCP